MTKLSAFIAGSALLILELLGLRLLTPAFGSSILVLSAVIGVFLLAMAVGYFLGGYLADRFPSAKLLSLVLIVSGILISLSALFAFPVAFSISYSEINKWFAPILTTLVLFSFPSCSVAMTSPVVIRLEARRIEDVGKVAGKIYAISTLGSIVGTLLVPLLIVWLPIRASLHITAGTLAFLGIIVWMMPHKVGKARTRFPT